jgi:hypothetical protein
MEYLKFNSMIENEKSRNVTFCVPESLIEEIDQYCKKNNCPRKEWFYSVLLKKDRYKNERDYLKNSVQEKNMKHTQLMKEHETLREKYLYLFKECLRYNTFWRRVKNIFVKFDIKHTHNNI